MNTKIFFLINLICLLFCYNNLSADTKIAYIDFDTVLSKINKGKILFDNLNSEEEKKFQEFKTKEIELKKEENSIKERSTLITKDQLSSDLNEYNKKIQQYKIYKTKEIERLKKKRKDDIYNLLDLINPIIEKYMSDNSISILFDKKNIYIADINLDITNNLIEIINKSFK